MPSTLHETLVEMFRARPDMAAALLAGPLGQQLPGYDHARAEPGDLADVAPTEYLADNVVTFCVADAPVLAVVVETQLHRNPDKRLTWPVYLTTLRRRLRCPAVPRAVTWRH